MNLSIEWFDRLLRENHVQLTDTQLRQFHVYWELLVEWNEKMNLTGITDQVPVYEKHFFDSISPAFFMDFSNIRSLIDVGTGAGFPAIPLKICFPHIHITLLDSLNKRLLFLKEVCDQLGLQDVTLLHGRAEDMGHHPSHREKYDVSVARAVAKLNVLNELCTPFVKVGGFFIALKAGEIEEEVADSNRSLQRLHCVLSNAHPFELPLEKSRRSLIFIQKAKPTPHSYPRKAGTPNKSPL